LDAASVWPDPDGTNRVDWMTIGMTMAHSILVECVMDGPILGDYLPR
jgi:hypothetical protein